MNIQLETIERDAGSSFRILVNPKLNDFFFWHFHPEYELVFIDGADGTRHVGDHIARYQKNDLVLIGSNIPHLNFDYGIRVPYEKTVLHIRADFVEHLLAYLPELQAVKALFLRSRHGLCFSAEAKDRVGIRIKHLHHLKGFSQLIEVLSILQVLAEDQDAILLHEQPYKTQYNQKDQDRLQRIYQFIDTHYQRKLLINEVAHHCQLSHGAFCRYFKKMTRLTFTEFLNHYRINVAKRLLLRDKNVTETCFACGFESLSYFNRTFKRITGMNPLSFKQQYQGQKNTAT